MKHLADDDILEIAITSLLIGTTMVFLFGIMKMPVNMITIAIVIIPIIISTTGFAFVILRKK